MLPFFYNPSMIEAKFSKARFLKFLKYLLGVDPNIFSISGTQTDNLKPFEVTSY